MHERNPYEKIPPPAKRLLRKTHLLTIKKFIALSLIIHAGILAGLYFIPESTRKKPAEFFASLVSPEEARKPAAKLLPPSPPVPGKKEALRLPSRAPVPPSRPEYVPSPDLPVVPGMGKETGKPLPEDASPQPEGRDKGGPGEAKNHLTEMLSKAKGRTASPVIH